MEIAAQTQTNVILLMLAGAVFTAAGLWLMLRPKKAADSAKIELFGMKFESSSAGLLVFIVGAGFLAVPLFVEVVDTPSRPVVGNDAVVDNTLTGDNDATAPLVLPKLPDVDEVEPNDDFRNPNQLALGTIVKGHIDSSTSDWFIVPLPGIPPSETISLNVFSERGYSLFVSVYDEQYSSSRILQMNAYTGTQSETFRRGDNEFVYIRVTGLDALYELSLEPVLD